VNLNLTLIGQSIVFAVFVWFCLKFIWPFIINAMRERQQNIADGLEAAERAEKDLELAQRRAADHIKEAREEAAEIIEQARRRGAQMIEEAKHEAREEGERVKEAAQSEIEQSINRAREQLREEVASLAVAGAERILSETIDRDRHRALLERLAAEL
jgi:F-type H+-transporting ATPase subunit b